MGLKIYTNVDDFICSTKLLKNDGSMWMLIFRSFVHFCLFTTWCVCFYFATVVWERVYRWQKVYAQNRIFRRVVSIQTKQTPSTYELFKSNES